MAGILAVVVNHIAKNTGNPSGAVGGLAVTVLLSIENAIASVAALCALTGRRWWRWPDLATR